MKKISIYVPQSAVMEAISPPYRLFKTANQFLETSGNSSHFNVEFVGLGEHVQAQDGIYSIRIDRLLHQVIDSDLIIIPALYGDIHKAVEQNQGAIKWIQQLYEKGAEVASLCTGAFLLAETGILDGKKCSTHWAYYELFRTLHPDINLVDGEIITDVAGTYSSGGANSLWNLLLYLLEKYTNREIAILASKYFAIDLDRRSQGAFTMFKGQKNHQDESILQIQEYIEEQYADKLTIQDLSTLMHMGRRTFERRFKQATHNTPIEYIQRVRIESAKRYFEESQYTVNEVMYKVGYSDPKSFRDVFKRITGLTPAAYRDKFAKILYA